MAWNEPGNGDGNKKDPWGNKGNRGGQQPPDLDEVFSQLLKKLSKAFGGGKGPVRPVGSTGGGGVSSIGIGFILGLLAVLYLISGIYIVTPAEKGVVFQFGAYKETVGPGPHWLARMIQSKTIVNVEEVATTRHEAHMLTKDENIVSVELGVQYRVGNVEDYLFNVKAPELTLEQVTDSALRQVIGHSTLDDILTSGREAIRTQIKAEIVRLLGEYRAGLDILDVPMQPAKAPEAVKEAFDDAIKAQEDEVRSINRARAYEKQKLPLAEGQAERRLAEAAAYKTNVILQAEGDADRFTQLLPEYKSAPKVTRERLYLDAISTVFSNTSKIMVDATGSNNLFYLPLDKMIGQRTASLPTPKNVDDFADSMSTLTSQAKSSAERVSNIARSNRWNTADSRGRSRETATR